jgi:hypothetical protein
MGGARPARSGRIDGNKVGAGIDRCKFAGGSKHRAAIVWACMLGALLRGDRIMTLCPIAIVAGCKKCPAFSVCPLKTVIGDMPKAEDAKTAAPNKKK